jgi:D-glucosaminate-6-phosphate ammonia-lyase
VIVDPPLTDPLSALARLLTAEAACVCSSPAAAVAVAVAGCVAGLDLAAVRGLPEVAGRERRVVLPRGQVVELDGVSVLQLLRLGGARPVEVGAVERCAAEELAAVLAGGAAAGLYVDAGHAPVGMAPFVWECRGAGVPALVVGVGAGGPLAALDAGADLLVLDVSRCYGGPPAGLIAGRGDLVAACALQEQGIGALFRPDPGAVAATLEAVRSAAADLAAGYAVADLVGPAG